MAELNFPKDRTELIPPSFGALQTGDEYRANGTVWIYDSVAGAWGSGGTGDSLSDLYLSKVIADTAADVISFDAGAQLKNLTNAPALATDADGTIIAGDGEAVKLKTARSLWGQPFDGTADVTGAIEGVNNITGANANMTIKPKDATTGRSLTLRGNQRTDDTSLGGNTLLGTTDYGSVHMRAGLGSSYRLYKPGGGAYSIFDLTELSVNRTIKFPDAGGEFFGLTFWGQNANNTGNVTGAITGANNITGVNADMTIKPGDGSRKTLILTGGGNSDDSERGAVYIGNSISGHIRFRCRNGYSYGFYKAGASSIGYLNFDALTTGRTYSFPNFGGNVVITGTGNNADTRFGTVQANTNFYAKSKIVGHPNNSSFTAQGSTNGTGLTWDGVRLAIARNDSSTHNSPVWVNRSGRAGKDGAFIRFQFDGTDPDQTEIKGNGQGKIQIRGLTNSYRTDMDARKVGNSLTDITNATTLIKALEPKREGFVAQNVGRIISHAVDSLNETQTVELGTYTDINGVQNARVEQPEAIPYGETWEKTEDYDLPVGLDQSALIPFLTKALQEAIDKIETLETRLNDAGIA